MSNYDVVVIGSGNAGLTAAVTAQRMGKKTLLVEKHNIPGGCATSFVRGDFEFEVALHQLSGLGTEDKPFIMRQIFNELGVMDKVQFVQEKELYRLVIPNELDITLPASWSGIRKVLHEQFPQEISNIDHFMQICEHLTMESFKTVPHAQRLQDQAFLEAHCPYFMKYGFRTLSDVVNEIFQDQKLISVVIAYWYYTGAAPNRMLFSDLAVMLYAYAVFKPWHIKGGSQAMSNALLESFLEAGGEARFNCGVEKILTQDRKVSAVRLEDGSIHSCHAVISNASPILTFNELLDIEAPEKIKLDFKSRRMGTSAFVIYLGLDRTPEQLGIHVPSMFISRTTDWEKVYDVMETFHSPISGMLTCYNVDDADAAPTGKSQVVLVCLQYADVWNNVAPEQYAKVKYEFADQLIDLIESTVCPDIRTHIEELEAATPLTMMRYLNSPGGAIYGFNQNATDSALIRDRLNTVEGLYFAGSWTSMGGFQPTYTAGVSTARAVVKTLQKQELEHV